MSFEVKELKTKEEMLQQLNVLQFLYPELTLDRYAEMLTDMLNANYGQVAVFDDAKCVAISGFWFGTKLWCGKYIELDNVVVDPTYRSKGVGRLMSDFLENKALGLNCTILVLDAYTTNFGAHRFYYNQGFGPKGFHFVKVLNEDGLT